MNLHATQWTQRFALAAVATVLVSGGCDMSPSVFEDNEGSTLNTNGQQITTDMLVGKWDLDGERTNTANGNGGVVAIPSDIVTDVLGEGWKFHQGGGISLDRTIGTKEGTWRLDGDSLTVQPAGEKAVVYKASFRDGFLYLKPEQGRTLVFERNKFFGF